LLLLVALHNVPLPAHQAGPLLTWIRQGRVAWFAKGQECKVEHALQQYHRAAHMAMYPYHRWPSQHTTHLDFPSTKKLATCQTLLQVRDSTTVHTCPQPPPATAHQFRRLAPAPSLPLSRHTPPPHTCVWVHQEGELRLTPQFHCFGAPGGSTLGAGVHPDVQIQHADGLTHLWWWWGVCVGGWGEGGGGRQWRGRSRWEDMVAKGQENGIKQGGHTHIQDADGLTQLGAGIAGGYASSRQEGEDRQRQQLGQQASEAG
jgi:hypothetical protein